MSACIESTPQLVSQEPGTGTNQQARWYAVYTRPRHEKAVAEQCRTRGVEAFLPLYTARRQWKQRTAEVELPLFPAYIFVRMVMSDRLKVLTIPSTVNLVSFQGAPAVVPDEQIEALANATANRKIEPYEYLGPGNRVRIALGAFAGVEGTIVRKKDRLRFVVSFDWMCRSVALLIDGCDIEQLV